MTDWAIVAARLLQFSAALILFGSPLFYLYGFGAGATDPLHSRLHFHWSWAHRNVLAAAVGAFLGIGWWVVAQTAAIFPDAGIFDPNAIWILLTETRFGRIAFLRAALFALAVLVALSVSPRRAIWLILSLLGAVALASLAWTGHGVRDSGWAGIVHTGADVLHLLAAGVWIGALVTLGNLIWRSSKVRTESEVRMALQGLERFSGVGPMVVAVLVLTGIVNSWFLIGIAQWQAMFTTAYGIGLAVKLALFMGMLILAADNRWRLSPRLRIALANSLPAQDALLRLRRSVLTEMTLSILVLLAVSYIGIQPPPVEM